MDFPLCLVDVRDVAEAHLLALEAAEASGERFILSGTPQCMYASDLAPTMRALFPTFPCPVRASPPRFGSFVGSEGGSLRIGMEKAYTSSGLML